jgi:RNA polymerase sigma factor (sigma-70 family)
MDEALKRWGMAEQDRQISDAMYREQSRLRNFIRRRVADQSEAEDILQDVFYELVEAVRLMKPIEQVTAWLFRVARNRIADLFRRRVRESSTQASLPADEESETWVLEDLLPAPDGGPDAAYVRSVLAEEIEAALDELPKEQRDVFVAHELMGYSFKELSQTTGVSVNTLLSRKHYAVVQLRAMLRDIYNELVRGCEL